VILHYFNLKKTVAETHRLLFEVYSDEILSERTCRVWFEHFRNDDFDVRDKERPGQPKKFEDSSKNSVQTLLELSKALNVTPKIVSRCLHAMRKIHKERIWLPHGLSENAILDRSSSATSLLARQRKKSLLWRIVIGDEKWIYFDNPMEKSWVNPGQPSASTPKRNIHGHKTLRCI